jgi:serine/threonine-protein kinase
MSVADDDAELSTGEELLRQIAHVSDAPPPSSEPNAPAAGTRLAHFELLEKLGSGGMGVVYRARDEKLRRDVALKILRGEHARDGERRRRFLREARAASALDHPNVAAVFEIGEDGEAAYIAMELVEGESLRARLSRGPVPQGEALRIGREIASALAKAHAAGIIHRDVKPENVMLEGGAVKVLDFGLAKLISSPDASGGSGASTPSGSELTVEGRILGTPSYMSPEQASGRPTDARSDVFSLGVLLYEMLAGERPFKGDTTMDVLIAINRDEPAPLASRAPRVRTAVAAVVAQCLRKDRDARWADGGELAAALERAMVAPRPRRARAVLLLAVAMGAVTIAIVAARAGSASPAPTASSAVASDNAIAREPTPPTSLVPLPTSPQPNSERAPPSAVAASPPPSAHRAATIAPKEKSKPAASIDPLGDQK